MYRNLKISPDCNKIAFEYEDPENFLGSLWIENLDGTNSFELQSKPEDDILWHSTIWFNSTTVFFLIKDGSLMVTWKGSTHRVHFFKCSLGSTHRVQL